MANHEPWEYQAHVTDEWQRDTMVVQVRQVHRGHTSAVGQVLEDRDGMPYMEFRRLTDEHHEGREHLIPTPGIRLRHDVAVAMARAILTEAGKDADEVERLKAALEDAEDRADALNRENGILDAERHRLATQVDHLERLVEAKDAHLEREARVATLHVRVLEMGQADAEHEQARRHHPAAITTGAEPFREGQKIGHPVTLAGD